MVGSPLHADVLVHLGVFTLDAAIDVPAGSVLAVVGPNGSGKSTLLRTLAGLLRPTAGHVHLGETALTEASTGVLVPPARRRVGLLGQDPALFPHLSTLENVAFGPRSTGTRAAPARELARHWLDRVGMSEFARRRPAQLSGGQQQRVALARALAAEPEVLLLDEPLAALDAQSAPQLRQLLAETVRATRTTTVIVSHNVLDAVVLADQLAVLHEGRVAESGSVAEVLRAPRTEFTAALAGVNLIPGTCTDHQPTRVCTAWGTWEVREPPAQPGLPDVRDGQACVLRVRPSAVAISLHQPDGPNTAHARVRWLEPADGGVRVRMSGSPNLVVDVQAAAVDPDWLHPGAGVWLQVHPQDLQVGPSASQGAGASVPG